MRSTPGELFRATATGLFWDYAATVGESAVRFGVLATLARTLTPQDFGIMGIAMSVILLAFNGSQISIGQTLVRRHELDQNFVRASFTLTIALGLFVSTLVFASAGLLASLFREPAAEPILRFVSSMCAILGLGITAEALLQRNLNFRALNAIRFTSYVLGYGVVAVSLSFAGFGVWSLAIATVTQALLRVVLAVAIQPHSKSLSLHRESLKEILRLGGGLTISRLLSVLATQGDYILVGRFLGSQILGIYNRSYQLTRIPVSLIGLAISRVLLASFSRVQSNRAKLREAYLTAIAAVAVLGASCTALMVVFAPEIISVVLGDQWSGVVAPFRILALVTTFHVASTVDIAVATATGRVYQLAVRNLFYAGTVLVGVVIALPWGLPGVAVAVGVAISIRYILGVRLSLAITGARLRTHLITQRSGLLIGLFVAVSCFTFRQWGYQLFRVDWLVLGAGSLATVLATSVLIFFVPDLLGSRLRTLIGKLLALLPPSRLGSALHRRIAKATE
ncbi:MAG: lipopolysaccharide biosynthesis protein [Truepera sp.]|nr:lipopolysaccharide biosynthesis protein [Truepera sp.]